VALASRDGVVVGVDVEFGLIGSLLDIKSEP
jgi:hypothetical protein